MYERILVPLDGSELARQVFPYVAELATAFDSEVFLAVVCEPQESEYLEECQLYIGSEAEQLRNTIKSPAVKFRAVVLSGKPDEQIIDYAEKNDISLIVILSHGRSGIMPWTLGSTASRVLHKVGVPLIIVRARETAEELAKVRLFSRFLVPLDGSERSEAVLPYVNELAKKVECEVILLRVIEPGRHVHTIRGLEYVPFKDWDIDSVKTSAEKYLDEVSCRFAETKATTRAEVRVGDSAREIIRLATERGCGLIAMSSHGRSGIETWIYGSVTYKILQTSNTPVLVIRTSG